MRSLGLLSHLEEESSLAKCFLLSLPALSRLGKLRCSLVSRIQICRGLLVRPLSRIRRGRFFELVLVQLFVFRLLCLR